MGAFLKKGMFAIVAVVMLIAAVLLGMGVSLAAENAAGGGRFQTVNREETGRVSPDALRGPEAGLTRVNQTDFNRITGGKVSIGTNTWYNNSSPNNAISVNNKAMSTGPFNSLVINGKHFLIQDKGLYCINITMLLPSLGYTNGVNGIYVPESIADFYWSENGALCFYKTGMINRMYLSLNGGTTTEPAPGGDFDLFVNQATLSINSASSMTYGNSYTLSTSGGSGSGAVSYSIVGGTGTATLNGASLTVSKYGTILIQATKAASGTYRATTSATFTLTVNQASQAALSITSAASFTYGQTYTLSASGGTGNGAISYSIVTGGTGTATIGSGNVLNVTKAGTINVQATKASDSLGNYLPAKSSTFRITVNAAAQAAFNFTSATNFTYGQTYTLAASGGTGSGAITYEVVTGGTGTATIGSGNVLNVTKTGTINLRATKSGGDLYQTATANLTVTVNAAAQAAFSFTSATNFTYGQTYTLSASGGTGSGAITYEVVTGGTGIATIGSGNVLNVTKTGTINLRATKSGGDLYQTATANLTVTVNAAAQAALSIGSAGSTTFGVANYKFTTSGGSGDGAVTYTIQSNSTAAGTIVGSGASAGLLSITKAGDLYVKATKAADSNGRYTVIDSAVFKLTIQKAEQSGFALSLTTGSAIKGNTGNVVANNVKGGAVVYSIPAAQQSIATVDSASGKLTYKSAGTVTVTATSATTDNYNAASASVTITVSSSEAKIGNAYYVTLDDALTAATDGATITLLSNAAITKSYDVYGKELTLLGGGYTVTVAQNAIIGFKAQTNGYSTKSSSFTASDVRFEGGAVWQSSPAGGLAVNNGVKRTYSFLVAEYNVPIRLTDVTFARFDTGADYGVFRTAGLSVLTRCVFTANGAKWGGAIGAQGGTLTLDACEITGNQADFGGGIGLMSIQPLTSSIKNSTITGNRVTAGTGYGEAIYVMSGAVTCAIENTTLEGTVFLGYYSSYNLAKLTVNGTAMKSSVVVQADAAAVKAYDAARAANGGNAVDTFTLVESGDKKLSSADLKKSVLVKNAGYSSKAMSAPEGNRLVLVATDEYAAAVTNADDTVSYFFSVQDAVDHAVKTGRPIVSLIDSYNESKPAADKWANGKVVKIPSTVTIPAGAALTFRSAQRHVAADDTTITLESMPAGESILLKRSPTLFGEMLSVYGTLTIENVTLDGGAVWKNGKVIDSVSATGTSANAVTSTNLVYANAPIIRNYGALTLKNGAVLQNNENRYNTTMFGSQNYGGGIANLEGGKLDMQAGSMIKDCYAREGGAIQNVNRSQAAQNAVTVAGTITGCVSQTKGAAIETIYGAKLDGGNVVNGSNTDVAKGARIENNISLCNLGVLTVEEGGKLTVSGDATTNIAAVNTADRQGQYSIYVYNKYGAADIVEAVPGVPSTKPHMEGVRAAVVEFTGTPGVSGEMYLDDDCKVESTGKIYDPYFNLTGYSGARLKVAIRASRHIDTFIVKGATDATLGANDVRMIDVPRETISSTFVFSPAAGELKVGGYEIAVVQDGLESFEITGASVGLKTGSVINVNGQEFVLKADGSFQGVMKLKQVSFPAPYNGVKNYDTDGDPDRTVSVGSDNYTEFKVAFTPNGGVETEVTARYGVFTMDDNYNVYAPAKTTYLGTDGTTDFVKPLTGRLLPNDVKIDADGMMTFYIEGNKETVVRINGRNTQQPGGGKLTGATDTSLSITTEAGVQYMLADANGVPVAWQDKQGNPVTDWTDGDGSNYTFYGLTAGVRYTILKRSAPTADKGPGAIIATPESGITTLPAGQTSESGLAAFLTAYKNVEGNLGKDDFTKLIDGITQVNALDAVFAIYQPLHPTLKEIIKDEYNRLAIADKALELYKEYLGHDAANYLEEDYAELTGIYKIALAKLYTGETDADRNETFDQAVVEMNAVATKSAREDVFIQDLESFKKTGEAGKPDELPGDSAATAKIIQDLIDEIESGRLTSIDEIEQRITEVKLAAEKQRAIELIDKKLGEIVADLPAYDELSEEGKAAIDNLRDRIEEQIFASDVTTKAILDEVVADGLIELEREYAKQRINKDRVEGDSGAVNQIIEAAFDEIDATTDPSALNAIVKRAQYDAEVQRAKDAVNKKFGEIVSSEAYQAYTDGEKASIEQARQSAIDRIDETPNEGNIYDELDRRVAQSVFMLSFEQSLADLNAYRDPATDSEETASIIADGIDAIRKAVTDSPATVTTMEELLTAIADVKAAADFQREKDAAKDEIKAAFELLENKASMAEELSEQLDAVQAATTPADVAAKKAAGILKLQKDDAKKSLNVYVKDITDPDILAIIEAAKTKIDSFETDSSAKIAEIREKAETDALNRYKEKATQAVNEFFAGLSEKDEIGQTLESALAAVNAAWTFGDTDTAQADGILKLYKENAKVILDRFVQDVKYEDVLAIVDAAKAKIDAATTDSTSKIDELRAQAEINAFAQYKNIKLDELIKFYNDSKDSGKYNAAGLAELKKEFDGNGGSVADNAFDNLSGATDFESASTLYDEGIARLRKVKVASVGAGGVKPGETGGSGSEGEYDYPDDKADAELAGKIESSDGMDSNIELQIKKNDAESKQKIEDAIKNGAIVPAAGNALTEDTAKTLLKNKELKATFEVKLIYREGDTVRVVPNEDLSGTYTVKILLPKNMRGMQNLQIVYFHENGTVEVFETVRSGNYLGFTTTHFSDYTILGTPEVSLWWLIILLIVIVVLEIAFILLWHLILKRKSNGGDDGATTADDSESAEAAANRRDLAGEETVTKTLHPKTVKTYSFAPFMLISAVLIPNGAIPTIIVLGILALGLAGYIGYVLFKHFRERKTLTDDSTDESTAIVAETGGEEACNDESVASAESATEENSGDESAANDAGIQGGIGVLTVPTEFRATKNAIALTVRDTFGESVRVTMRANLTQTGLPLADTCHCLIAKSDLTKARKICFAYFYEYRDGSVGMLLKLDAQAADDIKQSHPTCVRSKFPKGNDWYSIKVDDTFDSMNSIMKIVGYSREFIVNREVESGAHAGEQSL